MGPRTGRGGGCCSGFGEPGYQHPGFGFGGGAGRGRCRGFGGGFRQGFRGRFQASGLPGWMPFTGPPTLSVEAEKESLAQQASFLQSQLDRIRGRLDQLMGKESSSE